MATIKLHSRQFPFLKYNGSSCRLPCSFSLSSSSLDLLHNRNSAIAKNPSGDSSFGRTGWFYINDSVVRPVMENDIESVANGTSPVKEETPYMLFYRRVDSSGQAPISEPVPTSNFNVPKQVPLLLSALSAELVYNDNNTLHCVPAIPAVTPTSHGDQFGSFTGQGFGPISLDDCDITCIKTAETPETTVPSKTPKCPTQATQKPKSTQPRRLATSKWSPDDERIGPFKTELEAEKHLFGIKSDDAGGPIKLIKKAWVNNKKKTGYMRIRIFYCGFHTSCKCEFRCRIMQTQEGLFYVLIGNWPHSGHYNDTSKSVIPAIVKASITPSKLEMTSTEFITWLKFSDAVVKTEFPLNLTTTPHAVSLQKRLKQKHSVGNGEDTTTRTWGSLNRSISQGKYLSVSMHLLSYLISLALSALMIVYQCQPIPHMKTRHTPSPC